MALVERFKQLECWQSSRELVKSVYLAARSGELSKDFETRSQFKRAALSVMNNIAEGFGRRLSDREFIRFLCISEGSSYEVKSMTYVLEDLEYLSPDAVAVIREKVDKTAAQTLGLIRYLRKRFKSKPND
jgi:four helix bundle protein